MSTSLPKPSLPYTTHRYAHQMQRIYRRTLSLRLHLWRNHWKHQIVSHLRPMIQTMIETTKSIFMISTHFALSPSYMSHQPTLQHQFLLRIAIALTLPRMKHETSKKSKSAIDSLDSLRQHRRRNHQCIKLLEASLTLAPEPLSPTIRTSFTTSDSTMKISHVPSVFAVLLI